MSTSNINELLEINLTNEEALRISEGLSKIPYDPYGNKQYITKIRIAAYKYFPARIIDILEEQKSSRLNPFIVFNNIPIDEDIYGSPGFSETGRNFKSGTLSENVICAFGSIIAEPYSISFEGPELVNNLTPHKEHKFDYTGLGSEVELDLHIENAALKFMSEDDCSPIGMFLFGIRKDPLKHGPKTYVADSRKALKLLSKEEIKVLRENNFIIRLPYRWRGVFSNKSENTNLCPIISGPSSEPRMTAAFYPDMVLPVNESGKKAFNSLYEAIKAVSIDIDITPRKLVYIDNRFAFHSREKFTPTFDEKGSAYRWVQRLFLTSSLWNFREFSRRGERVFDPTMRYGN